MPPRTRSSKKRARSPSPDSNPSDKTQTRSSKRTKKDALATTAASTIAAPTVSVAVSKSKDKDAANDRLAAPRFNGNFDMYAMRLPFLNSVFTPRRDYAALLKVIHTYQAKPDNTAQIFLPEDLSKAGRFESLAVLDPLQEWPFDLTLRSLTLKDS